MNEHNEKTCVLSADCERLLTDRDLYSQQDRYCDAIVEVRDEEGTVLFRVSPTILPFDVAAILAHGERNYQRGINDGRRAMQAAMRDLLNAAPLEPT
jgi:hypothetical protein